MTSATEKLAAAITEIIGDRCPDFGCTCIGCQTWAAFDEVRADHADRMAEVKLVLRTIASPPRVDISDSEFLAELVRPSARKLLAWLEKEVG